MSSLSAFQRIYSIFYPPQPSKSTDPIRIGLLGASTIAPIAVINPARSHPDVVVASVAARDGARAEAYAKRYSIPRTHSSYDELLRDPDIDAVYIPLPNGLHCEWALRALRAGKHVLLEKPSVSNAAEAERLFAASPPPPRQQRKSSPPAAVEAAPVLVEAVHYIFHPAFQRLLSLIPPGEDVIESARAEHWVPAGAIPLDDIRFSFGLAGGALMDFGSYSLSMLRQVFRSEPEEVLEARFKKLPEGRYRNEEPDIESAVSAKMRFPGGGIGEMHADLSASHEEKEEGGSWWMGLVPQQIRRRIPIIRLPYVRVVLREVEEQAQRGRGRGPAEEEEEEKDVGERHTVQKTLTLWNTLAPTVWHRIDVQETHKVYDASGGADHLLKHTWTETKYEKAYSFTSSSSPSPAGNDGNNSGSSGGSSDGLIGWKGKDWWTTYRFQLGEFVNGIKGRQGSGIWVSPESSTLQMRAIDAIYRRGGLPVRPTSDFDLS